MYEKRYFDQNGNEKRKYRVTVTQMTDDSYGNKSTDVMVLETWAVSPKKAESNIRYRLTHGNTFERPGSPAVFCTYKAELAS